MKNMIDAQTAHGDRDAHFYTWGTLNWHTPWQPARYDQVQQQLFVPGWCHFLSPAHAIKRVLLRRGLGGETGEDGGCRVTDAAENLALQKYRKAAKFCSECVPNSPTSIYREET